GLTVQVVDKNAGPDLLLALGTTNDRGAFSIRYSAAAALRQGKSAPDIQVRALAGNTLVGASEIRYDATATEVLDVVAPDAAASALPSEYATVTGALTAQYKGRLADPQETGERADITYLANKTGWDARTVAMAALADRFSAATSTPSTAAPAIAPALFYA